MELILASASPRRKELLEQIGLKARILVPQVDESRVSASAPASLTMELAQLKAKDVVAHDWSQGQAPVFVRLGRDTVVASRGKCCRSQGTKEAIECCRDLQEQTIEGHRGMPVGKASGGRPRRSGRNHSGYLPDLTPAEIAARQDRRTL